MLCTVIWDVYRTDERNDIWQALCQLLPKISRDWSRKGVYAFWDPSTRELLYVGLATDLPTRFAQHNGLVSHSGGNKLRSINSWFATRQQLGFTLLLKSGAVQILDLLYGLDPTIGVESDTISRIAEGQLIELYRMEHGRRPPWNGVGGSVRGAEWAQQNDRSVIRLLSGAEESLFVARRSLRTLVSNPLDLRREALLHGARMHALMELEMRDIDDVVGNSDAMAEHISRYLMFRDGKIVDGLVNSDELIQMWLERFAYHDAMNAYRNQVVIDIRALREVQLERDQRTGILIEMLLTEGVDDDVAQAAAEVLAS
jgi:hypothetical protein